MKKRAGTLVSLQQMVFFKKKIIAFFFEKCFSSGNQEVEMSLENFLSACRPASVAADWLRIAHEIDPDIADEAGCRWCGREILIALEKAEPGSGLIEKSVAIMKSWSSRKIPTLLIPYKRDGQIVGIKALAAPRYDEPALHPPCINLTTIPYPLWIDSRPECGDVILTWGEISALRQKSEGDKNVIGLPGYWPGGGKWAPLFEGLTVILDVPRGEHDRIAADLQIAGARCA